MSDGPDSPTRSRSAALDFAVPWVGPVLAVGAWWLFGLFAGDHVFLQRFRLEQALGALSELAVGRELWSHVATSLRRIAVGLVLSIAIGFPLGVALGSYRQLNRATSPVLHFVRMVSPLAWTPLAIMLFGIGDQPVVFLLVMAGIWPIALATSAAVTTLDDQLTTVGRALGGSRFEIARRIVWPSIRSQVLTGVRVSIGLEWVVLVPAEMLGVDSGLGYFILSTRDRLAYSELVAAILVVGALGLALDLLARRLLSGPPGPTER